MNEGGGRKNNPHYCGPFFCKNIPPLLPLFHFSFPFHKFATEFQSLWQKTIRDGEIMFHVRKKRFCDIEKNFLAVSKDSFSQTQRIISCDSEILFLRSRKDIRKNNILAIIFCSPDASHNFLGRKNTFSIFLVRKKCYFVVTENFSWPRKCFSATAKIFLAIAKNKFWLFPKNFAFTRKISETARNYSF